MILLLFMSGNIELIPGPKKPNSCYNSSVCHWNLEISTAYNFEKVELLNACNPVNKFDLICISEPYLDFCFLPVYLIKKKHK